ncbi:MAG TPA: CCA tRNA nucleotidyltransferase [Candidatus Limnocylindrales bacterium]|nr:CCA tRNA nucleotidyltransferase [Candidatus Limnocylindrales bacterium]
MSTTTGISSRELAASIVQRLQRAGFVAFWVGGCVRDVLLRREPQDYDIATDARPEQIEKLFKRTLAVGRKFGVMIVVEGKHQFQVATFRAEAEYRDGRRPEKVVFSSAEADAQRRDFTVNGLFFDPVAEKLHDWVGGEKDLRARIIRTIGSPEERFAEDHLRLLRAVRFAAQLGFEIEPQTFAAVKKLAPKIELISAERIRDELIKLFAPDKAGQASSLAKGRQDACPAIAARGLVLLRDSRLLPGVLPELIATLLCEQSPDYHPEGTVFEHIRLMLEKMPPNASPSLPWAVILHDIAKPATAERDAATGAIHFYGHEKVGAAMAERILQRLRFPKKQIEEIVACVRQHMQFKDVKQMRMATLRRLLLRKSFPLELELHRLDCLGSHGHLDHYEFLLAQAEELKKKPAIRPPLLTGRDLIKLGMNPGPAMGALLDEIREKQLADELKTPREAKAWVKKQLQKNG